MLKLKLQYFGHLVRRANSLGKTLGKIEAGGEGENRGWDDWKASLTQRTWVWASSGRWWLDREAWHAAVHGVTKSQTWLSNWTATGLYIYSPWWWWWWCEVTQSCPTLCDPMDCSSPGSSIHGILQARILEWVAISFSRGSSQPRDQTQVSCIAGRHFNFWATREALCIYVSIYIYKCIYLHIYFLRFFSSAIQ